MQATYGSFPHPANEVTLSSVAAQRIRNPRGFTYLLRKRVQLAGVIVLNTSGLTTAQAQSAIRTAIQTRELAYSVDGGNFTFLHDDGSLSAHSLDNASAIGGVRVVDFSFPKGDAAEYATQRTFTVTLEADYPLASGGLMSFQETIEVTGTGGPRKIIIETLNGDAQEQIVNQKTKVTITQRGSAVGYLSYPVADIPGPVSPDAERQDRRQVSYGSPTNQNGSFINWPVNWTYYHELTTPAGAFPNYK